MSLYAYLWGMKLGIAAAFSAWVAAVLSIDPETATLLERSLFFITLFLWLSGMFAFLLLGWRQKRGSADRALQTFGMSFRQGMWLGLFAVLVLWLQYMRALLWWDAALLAVLLLLLELYFLPYSHRST